VDLKIIQHSRHTGSRFCFKQRADKFAANPTLLYPSYDKTN